MNDKYTEEEYWELLNKYRSRLISESNEDIKNYYHTTESWEE